MKLYHFMFILLYYSSINLFSQDASFYIQIEDPLIVPEVSANLKTNEYKVVAKTPELSALYGKYKIKKFERAFPTAATPWLREVYFVICNDKNLGKELNDKYKDQVPLVEYLCEPTLLAYTPNDYGMAYSQTNLDLIKAKQAYDIAKDIPKISASITDTYFDLNHEDLNIIGLRGTNNSHHYHGTQVAGDIAAVTNNGKGIASIGYNTPLYVSTNWANDNEVLLIAQAGYRLINLSWFNGCSYSSIQDAIYNEIRNDWNTLVIAAAANNESHCGSRSAMVYPASYGSVISVTSVGHMYDRGYIDPIYGANNWKDVHEEVPGDSNTAHHHNTAVDICAPGYHVATTYITGTGTNGGNYGACWGTSNAAPQVAGVAALIMSINPCLTADAVANIILGTSDPSIFNLPENTRYIGLIGQGRLDAYAAVLNAAQTATITLQNQNLGTQDVISNYAIKILGNVNITAGSTVNFKTRKELIVNGPFEIPLNSTVNFSVDVYNPIYCP